MPDVADWSPFTPTPGSLVTTDALLVGVGFTANGSGNFALDRRWKALSILVVGNLNPMTLSVKGHSTGIEMVPAAYQSFNGTTGLTFVIPLSAIVLGTDTSIDVTANTSLMRILAQLATPPWLAADQPPAFFALGSGANQSVIAGVAGKVIYLFGIQLTIEVVGAAQTRIQGLMGSGGTQVLSFADDFTGPQFWDGHGAPLTIGLGLFFTIPANVIVTGTISYSQD